MRSGASSRHAQLLRRNTTSKGCRPLFIAWRENTASPANRAMEMVIQITPATGSPTEDGAIAVLLSLSLASDIGAAPITCAARPLARTPGTECAREVPSANCGRFCGQARSGGQNMRNAATLEPTAPQFDAGTGMRRNERLLSRTRADEAARAFLVDRRFVCAALSCASR